MPLVYRSIFADIDGRISNSVERLFVEWLGSKGLEVPESGLADGGGPLDSSDGTIAWGMRNRVRRADGRKLDRLRLIEELDDARWVTTVAWGSGSTAASQPTSEPAPSRWVWIDLEHEPIGGRPTFRPGSPRLVRELLAAGEAQDGELPLTSDSWTVRANQTPELARYIRSTSRRVPIIVFAADTKRAYDQDKLASDLARDLAGVAAVFRLADGTATKRLGELLPPGYEVYGGAMRTYLQDACSSEDVPTRHRVLGRASLAALGRRALPAVKDQILELSTRRPAPMQREVGRLPLSQEPSQPETSIVFGRQWVLERIQRIARVVSRARPMAKTVDLSPEQLSVEFDMLLEQLLDGETPPPLQVRRDPTTDDSALQSIADLSTKLEVSEGDRHLLEQLLEESQREASQSSSQVEQLRAALDHLQIEATETAEEADAALRRVRWLERRVRELGDSGINSDEELPAAPASVAETLVLARDRLEFLDIGPTDETAAELDLSGNAQLYAIKTWAALIALDAYARARSHGQFDGNFYAWCHEPPPGMPAISANMVATSESDSVETNPKLRQARVFPVPDEVEASRRAYMGAHIKIVKRGAPCPRLHFLDKASTTGRVYVGYLGTHLPTAVFG